MQLLVTESSKLLNDMSPSFMYKIPLPTGVKNHLRNTNTFLIPMVHAVNHGTEIIQNRGGGDRGSVSGNLFHRI